MKKILQLSLFSILILISYFFYIYFLKTNEESNIIKREKNTTTISTSQNNLIKNLKYQVKFDNNTQYIITADLSEIVYENNTEIVKMQKVTAQFIDQNNLPLIIKSDYANYNNSNYNTKFYNNVSINYDDNSINSKNLDLNFSENIAKIYNNVVYEGLNSLAKTDNIKIDLITKKVNIFMNDEKRKVELISK
jgi:lipopolysaccharide assembly outer membrane protein LptD (OstA)